jgi:hypothetical protein
VIEFPYIKIKQGLVEVNGKRIDSVLGLDVHYKTGKSGRAEVKMKIDADVDIEGMAEINQEQKEINKAIVEYETSEGFKTLEFKSVNDISSYADENLGVVFVEERVESVFGKELAIINLKSFVSFRIEKIKEYEKEVK